MPSKPPVACELIERWGDRAHILNRRIGCQGDDFEYRFEERCTERLMKLMVKQ
jgi:hypothetical protein